MAADLVVYVAVGFLAQLVDGALGMAFGVISTSVLLATGVTPAVASASVHAAEVFTTGLGGLSHLYHRNVNKSLFLKLAAAGATGGVLGAYVLTGLPEQITRPAVSIYLCLMALLIVGKALSKVPRDTPKYGIVPLGLGGGFLDAVGGGGWGPLVASTLLARNTHPRYAIGSVNLAEFFVTVSISITFLMTIEVRYYEAILGLVIGGGLAAPLAGYMVKRLPSRLLILAVACIVLTLGVYGIVRLIV